MRVLIDAQLPPALAAWIGLQGDEAEHVADVGLLSASDAMIAAYAERMGIVLVSKDANFLLLRLPDWFAFVWLRCGNASNRALQAWLAPRWSKIIDLLVNGERLVEAL